MRCSFHFVSNANESQHVTVRTLKYMYYARHPLEEFALKHLDYYPDENDQVRDLCARSPFAGSNVVVIRAVEDMFAPEIDNFDATELRRAEKLGKDTSHYRAREARFMQMDDTESEANQDPQSPKHGSALMSEERECHSDCASPHHHPESVSTKSVDLAEQHGITHNNHQRSCEATDQEAWAQNEHVDEDLHSSGEMEGTSSDAESSDSKPVTPGESNEAPMELDSTDDFQLETLSTHDDSSVCAAPEATPPCSQEQPLSPFTASVWRLLLDRLATLPDTANAALRENQYLSCAAPLCGRTLVLQPWTQFDQHHKAMCSACSDAFMGFEVQKGVITENTWIMYKKLMSHQLAIKQQRHAWGQTVNWSDDAPADHSGPLPNLAGPVNNLIRSDTREHESVEHASSSPQEEPRYSRQSPRFASPPRSFMTRTQGISLTSPMDTTTDSFFDTAKAAHAMGSASWTAQNRPQYLATNNDTIDPAKLLKVPAVYSQYHQLDGTTAPHSDHKQSPPNCPQHFKAGSRVRPGDTNFARPDIAKPKRPVPVAPPPASRQPVKRRAAGSEQEDLEAELAELGGRRNVKPGPRKLRQRRPSNLRYSKNGTASDDDFLNDDDEDIHERPAKSHATKNHRRKPSLKLNFASSSQGGHKGGKHPAQYAQYSPHQIKDANAATHGRRNTRGKADNDDDDDGDGEWTPEY